MPLEDDIRTLAGRIPGLKDRLSNNEAATKTALVLPFFRALGYDYTNFDEVEPEFDASWADAKGWKADYALKSEDKPVIIVECKSVSNNLRNVKPQLGRYFPLTDARIGLLTNGILYKFYTDTDKPNSMDEEPFWVLDLESLDSKDFGQLAKFAKGKELTEAISAASELSYIAKMKETLVKQYNNQAGDKADDAFAEWLARPLLPSRARMTDEIKGMARQALIEFVEELVVGRLRGNQQSAAPSAEEAAPSQEPDELPEESNEETPEETSTVVTTDEELEGYEIVKAIVGEVVEPDRVTIRDAQQYCAILFENNNRRPLCRLHFNRSQKYLGVFDGSRNSSGALIEKRNPINSLTDIHDFADVLKETARRYLES